MGSSWLELIWSRGNTNQDTSSQAVHQIYQTITDWASSQNLPQSSGCSQAHSQVLVRSDTGFLAFSFPQSLGSGVYDEINRGQ